MKTLLDKMQSQLTQEQETALKNMYAPTVVMHAPVDAANKLVVTRTGEIRLYCSNSENHEYPIEEKPAYYASNDCGVTWTKKTVENPQNKMLQSIYVAELDRYYCFFSFTPQLNPDSIAYPSLPDGVTSGTFVAISKDGPDGEDYEWYKVSDEGGCHIFRSMAYNVQTGSLYAVSETVIGDVYHSVVFRSVDQGKTWERRLLTPMPTQKVVEPHKGMRWQNQSCEPTIVCEADGALRIVFRTSYNHFHQYYSRDDGLTWSEPQKSPFHGTLTMPLMKKLSTGEFVFVWANTQPIPEFDHDLQVPELSYDEKRGRWEDYFTNRDANHIAISADGKSWQGFREIALSDIRNASDYRSCGGNSETVLDKSVHQFDLVELPHGKLLVHFGQHEATARLVILDKNWILEKSRKEDFRKGLHAVTTHTFLKSVPGGFRGFSGHCCFNRTHGAVLMPDPDQNFEETLFICRISDPRLLSETQGAVWNFPAGHSGKVSVKLRNDGRGVALTLTDRWFNAFDTEVLSDGQVVYKVTDKNAETGKWLVFTMEWKDGVYTVKKDGQTVEEGAFAHDAPNGLSYLHIQSLADTTDEKGTYIKYMEKTEN